MILRYWTRQTTWSPEGAEGGDPAPEPAASAEPLAGDEPSDSPAAVVDPEPLATPAKKITDWRDQRIATLTAQNKELRAANKTAVPAPGAPAGLVPGSPEFEQEVDNRASAQAQIAEFNRQCNSAAAEGRTAYADFDARVGALKQLVDNNNPSEVLGYNQFLSAALETGAASTVLHALGGDLDEAARILALPPVRMAVELTKLATKVEEEKKLSGAPRPIRPVGGRGVTHEAIDPADPDRADGLSTKAWMERRERQLAQRNTVH